MTLTESEIDFAIRLDRLRRAAVRHRKERKFVRWMVWFGVAVGVGVVVWRVW